MGQAWDFTMGSLLNEGRFGLRKAEGFVYVLYVLQHPA